MTTPVCTVRTIELHEVRVPTADEEDAAPPCGRPGALYTYEGANDPVALCPTHLEHLALALAMKHGFIRRLP